MRTTVTLAPDVAAAVAQLRAARGIGTSEALNEIARRGLAAPAEHRPFRQRTSAMRLSVDVRNVAEALDLLDDPAER